MYSKAVLATVNTAFFYYKGRESMKDRQRLAKTVNALLAWLLVLLCGVSSLLQPLCTQAATDYNAYSNTKKEWYVVRNKDHNAPRGADSAKNLKKYNAYYYDDQATEKVIYFAFDCGYENGYTSKMLDALQAYDAKAVFFVTEHYVKSHPELCKRMKQEGHLVGSHTMSHPSLPSVSTTKIKEELTGLEQLFKEKTGYTLDKYLRPPMGEYSDRVLKVAQDLGYTTIFWSIVYNDYDPAKQPGVQTVIDHFKTYCHKGAITLTHNVSSSNADALKTVLKNLKADGYRFARIDELGQPKDQTVGKPFWDQSLYNGEKFVQRRVALKWKVKVSGKKTFKPDGFEIYRKEKGGKYELIKMKKATKETSYSYTDRTVESGKTYYYRIRSYCYQYGRKFVSDRTTVIKRRVV